MNKRPLFQFGKNSLVIAGLTLLTALIWLSLEISRTLQTTTISKVEEKEIKPLNPQLDQEVFQMLKQDISLSEGELNVVVTPTLETSATESAIIETEPETESTESANIE